MTWALPLPGDSAPLEPALVAAMDRLFVPLAAGVEGLTSDVGPVLEVAGIRAAEPRIPGAVGAWLDTLPTDRPVAVPFVVSDRLAGMLARRGFVEWVDDLGRHYLRAST